MPILCRPFRKRTPSQRRRHKRPGIAHGILLFALLLALGTRAHAAGNRSVPRPTGTPEVARTGSGLVEVGVLDGASYRIDIPTAWNHQLVVFFHGYSEGVYGFILGAPVSGQVQPMLDRGYAVIQSGYSTPGWALAEAYPESEDLRLYFNDRYAKPAEGKAAVKTMETWAVGVSMGGALVTANLELNPKPFAGGLSVCGSVGPSDLAFQRRFAWRSAFDFYFPNLLPNLVPGPLDFRETPALRLKVLDALKANPVAASALRGLTELHTDRDLADGMVYFTFVTAEMQKRAGGNPFDNRNFLYTGTNPLTSQTDNALNDGVKRYAADPRARDYLMHHYTPTGRLQRPMLALHTTYDPRVPGNTLTIYAEQVALAGFAPNLVQQYVHRDGHCTFTEEEIGRSFDELVTWVHTGRPPLAGALPPAPRLSLPH